MTPQFEDQCLFNWGSGSVAGTVLFYETVPDDCPNHWPHMSVGWRSWPGWASLCNFAALRFPA